MAQALGDILPLAMGIAVSPLAIIAVILMLITPRARANGVSFLLGWMTGIAAVATVVLIVSESLGVTSSSPHERSWLGLVKLVLGLVLLLLAALEARRRPKAGQDPVAPKWMKALDRTTPPGALGLSVVLSSVSPKTFVLGAAAALAVAQTSISGADQALAVTVLVVIGSLGILAPVAVYLARGRKATERLQDWRVWLVAHDAAVAGALLLVFGTLLIGKGIIGLAG